MGPEKAIQRIIVDKISDQLKMPFALWTRSAVRELIEARSGVVLSVPTVRHYLGNWCLTPRKPI